jgi:glycosyltransferase involved in cell wall biosynthesis
MPECNVIFSANQVSPKTLNFLYNLSDVTINLASNEGFGLGTAESVMAGTPIIVNVTGGLQDQCGFKKADGTYLTADDYSDVWGTNNDGKYTDCGEWAFPVFPKVHTMQGSIPTPYIWDDIVSYKEAADRIMEVYELGYEERKGRGLAGREHFLKPEVMLSAESMCSAFTEYMNTAFANWTPRKRFTLYTT